MNKIFIIICIMSITLTATACFEPLPGPPLDEYIKFRIADINFQNSEPYSLQKLFTTGGPNLYEFILADSTTSPFHNNTFSLHEPITYNDNDEARLNNLDTKTYYGYRVNRSVNKVQEDKNDANVLLFNLYDFYKTRFLKKDGNTGIPQYVELLPFDNPNPGEYLMIRSGTSNDLTFTYTFYGLSAKSIEVVFENDNIKEITSKDDLKSFNYNAEWEELVHGLQHGSDRAAVQDMLNIVIMADGYRNPTDLDNYKQAVQKMKDDLFRNNFFDKHRDKINIFLLNTVSLQQENNNLLVNYNIIGVGRSFSDYFGNTDRIKRVIRASFSGGPLFIEGTNSNIDAIIIVPRQIDGTYSAPYDREIALKNKQPVNIAIVSEGRSLAHQLGHVLARLQDEKGSFCSTSEKEIGPPSMPDIGQPPSYIPFETYVRNLTLVKETATLKWQEIIDAGYAATDKDNPDRGLGTIDFPFTNYVFGKNYYVPTKYSTMGEHYFLTVKEVTQFGPVNTYHLAATFRIRTGQIKAGANKNAQDEQAYTGAGSNYEWPGYSIADFKRDYPPSYFEND